MDRENMRCLSNDDIIRLLKQGRAPEIEKIADEQKRRNYPNQFPVFMDQMIDEYKVKKRQIALRSGLSQDYVYKLLRGDKHTDERDYIIAICMAVGMNIEQTRHALECYGMRALNMKDMRDCIIYEAIDKSLGMDVLNGMLEKMQFEFLKISPDMPTAKTHIVEGPDEPGEASSDMLSEDECRQVYCNTYAERCGNAPFDYAYWGEICIELPGGERYVLQSMYNPEYECMAVMNEKDKLEADALNDREDSEDTYIPPFIEVYDSFVDTVHSRFFRYFFAIDRNVDQKIAETLKKVDDTRYCESSYRVGGGYSDKRRRYIEYFNHQEPAKREYLMIVETQGELPVYTVSHESHFMQIELGDFYEVYFGKREPPEYFIKTTDLSELRDHNVHYRFLFNELQVELHKTMGDKIYGMSILEDKMKEEECRILVQRAVMMRRSGDDEASIDLLKQALDMMTTDPSLRQKNFESIACTYIKLGIVTEEMGREEEAHEHWNALYAMKDHIPDDLDEDSVANVRNCIAEAIKRFFMQAQASGDKAAELRWLKEQIDMRDGFCRDENEWIDLFKACIGYADRIDDTDPAAAEVYYQKSVDIARDHDLTSAKECRRSIPVLYNNYASLLWNKFASEEAIVYYSMAIDTTLSYFRTGEIPESEMKKGIAYLAERLKGIYLKTGKDREYDRLAKRLSNLGIGS